MLYFKVVSELFWKLYLLICKMQVNSWREYDSRFECTFKAESCRKEEESYKNLSISRTKSTFAMKYQTIFMILEGFAFHNKK